MLNKHLMDRYREAAKASASGDKAAKKAKGEIVAKMFGVNKSDPRKSRRKNQQDCKSFIEDTARRR